MLLRIDRVLPKARSGFWLAARDGEPALALFAESAVELRPGPGQTLAHSDTWVWRLRPKGASDWNGVLQERKGGSGPERTQAHALATESAVA